MIKLLRIAEGSTDLRGVRTTLLVERLGDDVDWGVVTRGIVCGDDGVGLFFPLCHLLLMMLASLVAALDPAAATCWEERKIAPRCD